MSERPPVIDWTTDFDMFQTEFATNPYPIFDEMRSKCPVSHTDRSGGYFIVTGYEELKEVAHDPSTFSSRQIVISDNPTGYGPGMAGAGAPPITSDPPFHTSYRRLLLPAFSPTRIDAWEPQTRAISSALIDKFIDKGGCDASEDYAQHVPTTVIALMLGVPPEDGLMFTNWVYELIEGGLADPMRGQNVMLELFQYLNKVVADHRANPSDDLVTYLMEAEHDGKKLTDQELLGTIMLLLFAGIDTTWSSIGSSLWHLAQNPDDLRRLVEEPELMPVAVEEFLRAYSPVTLAREVVKDGEIAGCPVKAGDRVLLPFPAGNRDPDVFPDADKVVIDRAENRHYAFGVGIHRCLGSNLARLEMRVALEEFIKRVPEFHLVEPETVRWSVGPVRGPRRVPLVFDRVVG